MKRMSILLLLLSAFCITAFAEPENLLLQLVEKSELNGGLLLLPRFGDSKEVVELSEKTPFIVVACASEEKRAASLRKEGADAWLLARKLYVEEMPDSVNPLAENSASLILVDDLADADLTSSKFKTWVSAISPRRGVMILGNRKAEMLDTKKLLDWASGEGAKAELLSITGSTFVLIRKPAPEGSDVWTHRFHDPANLRTSYDTTLKAPFGPAWYALPTNLGYRGDIIVSDGGRGYYIWANRFFYHSVSLICFDIHNGLKLWEQPFKWDKPRDKNQAGYYAGRSCMVALPDGLLLVDEDRLVILDGETGKELRAIQGPKTDGQIKWLGVEGDLVAVLAGEQDGYKVGTLQQEATNPFGTELAVYRISDGELAWKRTEPGTVDERELAIYEGKLYAHTKEKRMACSDLATGKIIWQNCDPELLEKLGEEHLSEYTAHSYRILVAFPEVLYFAAGIRDNRVVMDRTDGRMIWTEKIPRRKTHVSLKESNVGYIVAKQGLGYVDIRTNTPVDPIKFPPSQCCPGFATTDLLISQFGGVNSHSGELLRRADQKSACDLGVVIADGTAFSPPSACSCNYQIHGYRAFTSMPSMETEDFLPRLNNGPAAGEPLGVQNSKAEWRCWRGDNRHSGSLSAKMPAEAPKLKWHWKPVQLNPVPKLSKKYAATFIDVPEHLPTQAVSADGVCYFGDSQGVLRAVLLKDGKELWNLPLGFKLTFPPALARGRVVAGTMDGQVVCVDAKSGRLAWRYRVPEQKRRILWYGHLADTQPLIGGALIHGDTIYTVAGFSTVQAIHVAALDLASGKPKWTKAIPHDAKPGGNLGSMGAMTVAAGRLFIQSGSQVPVSFDLESGELKLLPAVRFAASTRYGKDLAAVDDDWIIYGGRQVFNDYNRWNTESRGMVYSLCRTDHDLKEKPGPAILGVELQAASALMPVFDGELFIAFSEYPARRAKPGIKAWKREDFLQAAAGTRKPKGWPAWKERALKKAPFIFGQLTPGKGDLAEKTLWTRNEHLPYTAALGSDALIVIHPKGVRDRINEHWQISALERTDGSVRWTVDLPGRSIWDGLSLSSDGSILIAMFDGSILAYGKN